MQERFGELKKILESIQDQIIKADDYQMPERVHTFEDVLVSWDIINGAPVLLAVLEHEGEPLGMLDVSNKYLSYFMHQGYCPDQGYGIRIAELYERMLNVVMNKPEELEIVADDCPYLWFTDTLFYLPSHHYEDSLNQCASYNTYKLDGTGIISPDAQHLPWFKKQVEFFTDSCLPQDTRVFWMPQGKVMRIKRFNAIRQYHGITEKAHEWFSRILRGIASSEGPTPEKLCLIKFVNEANATNWRSFKDSDRLKTFLSERGYALYYPDQISEREKIRLLCNAKQVVLSWGANSCINFGMILCNWTDRKKVLILGHREYRNEYLNGTGLWNPHDHSIRVIPDLDQDCFDANDTIYTKWQEWDVSPLDQEVENAYIVKYKEKSLRRIDEYKSLNKACSSLSVLMKHVGAAHGRERLFRYFFEDLVREHKWQVILNDDRSWGAIVHTRGILNGKKGWKRYFMIIKLDS